MEASFRYVISNKGVNSASIYPYRARVSRVLQYRRKNRTEYNLHICKHTSKPYITKLAYL